MSFAPDLGLILDASSGQVLDRFALPGRSVVHDPTGDLLLYSKGEGYSHTVLYNLMEQKIVWEQSLFENIQASLEIVGRGMSLVAGSTTFVATKGENGIVGGSLEDGGILWHVRAPVPYGVPRVVEDRVYALTQGLVPTRNDHARFMCIDADTGCEVYETAHRELLAHRPTPGTLAHDFMAFGNEAGLIFAFRLSDGDLCWSHRTTGQTSQPVVAENRLYVTSDDGYLLLFERKAPPAN